MTVLLTPDLERHALAVTGHPVTQSTLQGDCRYGGVELAPDTAHNLGGRKMVLMQSLSSCT